MQCELDAYLGTVGELAMIAVALTIAGSDPSGGAGLQADLKTFHQHGLYGTSVVTLLTVQNTQAVSAVEILDGDFVLAQLDAVLSDIPPNAAKTGALGNVAIIEAIAERAKSFSFPLVVDPVMVSKHGAALIDDNAVDAFTHQLLPNAFLVTPNLHEAAKLSALEINDVRSMEEAATVIARFGVANVLVKGGDLDGDAVDVLWTEGQTHILPAPRVETRHTHGTGCVLSAAITARLAKGEDLVAAVKGAKQFITAAIRTSPGLGSGFGPVNLHSGPGDSLLR
jgi:hydroxymethylpyrimidine/phosphomethylpyrimidine kinase